MNKKTFALIGFVATAATFLFAAAPKDPGEGKFHLVYLVSAIDLKPGSKAFVDPVFFTDGRQIKPFHDYCRSHLKAPEQRRGAWKMDPKPHLIVDDQAVIHAYCKNTPVVIRTEKFHTLNNTGLSIRLSSIKFSPNTRETTYVGTHDLFPHPGSATLTALFGKPLAIALDSESGLRPQYFFLMSSNRGLLERLVPVHRCKVEEAESLINVARRYAEEAKGRYKTKHEERKRSPGFENVNPKVVNALFADLDGDGVTDAVMGITAQSEQSHWGGLAFLYSKKDRFFIANLWQLSNYQALMLPYGYVDHTPLALIQIGGCSYIFSMPTELGKSYSLISRSTISKDCQDLNLTRIEERAVD